VALVGASLCKLRLLTEIGAARKRVHGKARNFNLLAPVRIEVAHLGDGRGLAQQAKKVETSLIETAARREKARGPADLPLDLLDELFDDSGGPLRLLALHGDECLTALAVGVVHFDGGIDDERSADKGNQQGRILAK